VRTLAAIYHSAPREGRLVELASAVGHSLDLFDSYAPERLALLDGTTGRDRLYPLPINFGWKFEAPNSRLSDVRESRTPVVLLVRLRPAGGAQGSGPRRRLGIGLAWRPPRLPGEGALQRGLCRSMAHLIMLTTATPDGSTNFGLARIRAGYGRLASAGGPKGASTCLPRPAARSCRFPVRRCFNPKPERTPGLAAWLTHVDGDHSGKTGGDERISACPDEWCRALL
jgi:hypothetical protein